MSKLKAPLGGGAPRGVSPIRVQEGIYSTLAKEHGKVATLIRQAIVTTSAVKREDLIETIRVELISDSVAEERTLYDALKQHQEIAGRIEQNLDEHVEMKRLLTEVSAAADEESQTIALEALQEAVEFHVDLEEGDLFPQAHDLLSRHQEFTLGQEFNALKNREKRKLEADRRSWGSRQLAGAR